MEFMRSYEVLLKKSKIDFEVSELIYKSEKELDIEIAIFHLQQAVEKILKALLIFYKIEAPRTHKLEVLMKLIEDHKKPAKYSVK